MIAYGGDRLEKYAVAQGMFRQGYRHPRVDKCIVLPGPDMLLLIGRDRKENTLRIHL